MSKTATEYARDIRACVAQLNELLIEARHEDIIVHMEVRPARDSLPEMLVATVTQEMGHG